MPHSPPLNLWKSQALLFNSARSIFEQNSSNSFLFQRFFQVWSNNNKWCFYIESSDNWENRKITEFEQELSRKEGFKKLLASHPPLFCRTGFRHSRGNLTPNDAKCMKTRLFSLIINCLVLTIYWKKEHYCQWSMKTEILVEIRHRTMRHATLFSQAFSKSVACLKKDNKTNKFNSSRFQFVNLAGKKIR